MANKSENDPLGQSGLGKELAQIMDSKYDGADKVDAASSTDEIKLSLLELRALVARLRVLPSMDKKTKDPAISPNVKTVLDGDLLQELAHEMDPEQGVHSEILETKKRIRELLNNSKVHDEYKNLFNGISVEITKSKELLDLYQGNTLSDLERIAVVRQLSRLLANLVSWCDDEEQNIHNQVTRERRGYKPSDTRILSKLKNYRNKCQETLDSIKSTDVEAQIQLRIDQINLDRNTLNRRVPKDIKERSKGRAGNGYIVTESRQKILFGSEESPEQSIISALRKNHNVECFGPTGTGKTKLVEHAAMVFSGKKPIIVSGNPGVSNYHFFGKPVGLDKRDDGAAVKCMKEGRVLIIDEDNRIDPNVLASVKYLLGLRSGDVYLHPETGEEITIKPGFGIIVTRNEKGKHHKDRFELPPDYRREFIASFEIGYFTKEEMYDRFLLPKLCNDDGSMSLSENDVGGKFSDPNKRSPLLSLTIGAEKIQELYARNEMTDGVMESGWLISLFDEWQEQHLRTNCTFLNYLETRLLEFIKRPIGNPNRKKIIEVFTEQGFFQGKTADLFKPKEGELPITDPELNVLMKKANNVFKPGNPGDILDSRAVALLDPFESRNVKVSPHPKEEEIEAFKTKYYDLCMKLGIRAVGFSPHNFQQKIPAIVKVLSDHLNRNQVPNKELIMSVIDSAASTKSIDDFLKTANDMFDMFE